MRALCFAAAVLLVAQPAVARPARREAHVQLDVGERYVIPDNGIESFSESGPALFDVEVDRASRLVVIGRRPGMRSILLSFEDHTQRRYVITVKR